MLFGAEMYKALSDIIKPTIDYNDDTIKAPGSIDYANIMMIGKTGVGKSSFLNYLLQEDRFKAGTFASSGGVTQGFETCVFDDISGIPLRVYDSKGLEVKDFAIIKKDLINFLREQCGNSDPMKWIHSIFYCINVKGGRLEKPEIDFINDICGSISQTIHIVLTNCDAPDSSQVIEMEKYIRSILKNQKTKIIKVNSVETNSRIGKYKQFGREEALKTILNVLWSDICTKVSNNYADEYYKCINNQISEFRKLIDRIADNLTIGKLVNTAIKDDFEIIAGKTDDIEQAIDREADVLSSKYVKIINPLIEFYKRYVGIFGFNANISKLYVYKPDCNVYSIINFDKAMDRTEMGRFMKDTEDAEDFSEILPVFGKSLKYLFTLKKTFHYFAFDLTDEMKKQLPPKEKIANEMYLKIMNS